MAQVKRTIWTTRSNATSTLYIVINNFKRGAHIFRFNWSYSMQEAKQGQNRHCRGSCSSLRHHWGARVCQEVPAMRIKVSNVCMRFALPTCFTDMWLLQTL